MLQSVLATLIALLLAALLYRNWQRTAVRRSAMPEQVLGPLRAVLDDVEITAGEAAGVYQLSGRYRGEPVAIKAVTDLLMLRKLPSLWLMVTLPGGVDVPGTLDVMLRPAGQSSFSNFDFLPVTLATPPGIPETAVIRSDNAAMSKYIDVVSQHPRIFTLSRLKELLITPKGMRLVTLLAEGERARYGVYRQAEFGDAAADPANVRHQLELLRDLKASLNA
jgi:hypothetical protein